MSIALAQAFQFDGTMRQKDIVGEWVPMDEPGPLSDTISGNEKWVRGIRFEEIDQNLILRHVTSKRQKAIEVNLRLAPMVMDELHRLSYLPSAGPVIVREYDGKPWRSGEFCRQWRKVARAAGVPDAVFNMDSRSGGITEATDAGAELEHVRHMATHGDIAMTQRYSRGSIEKVAKVMEMRVAHRNKPGSGEPGK